MSKGFAYPIPELIERLADAQIHANGHFPNGTDQPQKKPSHADETLRALFRSVGHTLRSWRDNGQFKIVSDIDLNADGQDPIELTRAFAVSMSSALNNQRVVISQGGLISLNGAKLEPGQA